jgi:hypothetical protein
MVSHHKVARDTTEFGMLRLVRALAVIMPCLALLQVLANSQQYRQPAVAVAVWLAVLGAAGWLVPRLGAGGLAGAEVTVAIAIAVAAVAAIGVVQRAHDARGGVDLSILGTVWLLVLVVRSRPARVWIPAALLIFAVHGALLLRTGGLNPPVLSQLLAAAYITAASLIVFATLPPAMATQAALAARQASLASAEAAERAAAAAIQQERRGRLAVLEQEALPLLRGIADGTLDPTAADVRAACARHAAVLRHSLAGGTRSAGELIAGLGPALRAAEARGMLVNVQLMGDPGTPQPPVARAILATVAAVISELPPHQVILTVLGAGDDVELYLTFGEPLRAVPDLTRFGRGLPAAVRWHAAVVATESGGGYLEVSWRTEGAS